MTDDVVFVVAGREQPKCGREVFAQGLCGILATHRIDSHGDVKETGTGSDIVDCRGVPDVRVTPMPALKCAGIATTFSRCIGAGVWCAMRICRWPWGPNVVASA